MSEQLQEQAALHALGILEPGEARLFEQKLTADASLRALKNEYEATAAELGALVTPQTPPTDLKDRLMDLIEERPQLRRPSALPTDALLSGAKWMVRAVAAALAITTAWLWSDRQSMESRATALEAAAKQAAEKLVAESQRASSLESALKSAETQVSQLKSEVVVLQEKDALARMQIATLQSNVSQYKQGVAVVVWDSEKHTGILKLEKMPPLDTKKDYQLWVVDPKNPTPVDAGVIQMDSKGFAKIDFKPVDVVSEAAKFAISVERKGGVPKAEGPIVFIGP
jgi:anti-sigma-K factor RskA